MNMGSVISKCDYYYSNMCSGEGGTDDREAETEAQSSMKRNPVRQVNPNRNTYNVDIIDQLSEFGYDRHEIIFAMSTVSDQNDINQVKSALDSMINTEHINFNGMNGHNGINGHYDHIKSDMV